MAPSTMLLTFSSKLHDTRAATGFNPKALLTEAGRAVLSSLEEEAANEAETLHPTEATEAAIATELLQANAAHTRTHDCRK